MYHTEAHGVYRLRSLESLLCTCISCNYNLTRKHIHSHSFSVPEQNNKLAAITHICGSVWLNPCCTVSSSCGGHFPELLLIHNKWPLYGFTLGCLAMISSPLRQCLSVKAVKKKFQWKIIKAVSSECVSSKDSHLSTALLLLSLNISILPHTSWLTRLDLGRLWGGGAFSRLNHLALCLEPCSN